MAEHSGSRPAGNKQPSGKSLASRGRASRRERVLVDGPGTSGTSSQDFARLAGHLFEESAIFAQEHGGNTSMFVLAGIPMLMSAFRCLLIELNSGFFLNPPRQAVLSDLASSENEVAIVLKRYSVPPDLSARLELLREVRHEIVHPAHRAAREENNTPTHLLELRRLGLLDSTGATSDYIWLGQLQSHRLFEWAFETISGAVGILLDDHELIEFVRDGYRASYARYRRTP